jgi:DNA-binding CsgD family transcriptional regulator
MSSEPDSGPNGARATIPRAVIHQKILDAFESNPGATIETIATDVSGASPSLVGRVLDEYGDPAAADDEETDATAAESEVAEEEPATGATEEEEPDSAAAERPELADLTEKQREVVRTIDENPGASQRDIASLLGVSGATINVRVNSIPGFDWEGREEFVTTMLENETEEPETRSGDEARRAALSDRVDSLERRLDRLESDAEVRSDRSSTLTDPDLTHKVVHACMSADHITTEEELRIIDDLLDS